MAAEPSSLPTAAPIVTVNGLRKRFGVNEVLKGIDLDVKRGEVIAIIGKSGSGKSTLLRCINGLETFDQGTLAVDGQALRHGDAAAMRELRQHVGMIFQSFNLFPHLSVGRNVMLAPTLVKKRSAAESADQARKLLQRVGLAEKFDAQPDQLSGGQQQRVAIARALATSPEVLLCDEPTSALDAETTRSVLDTLRDINQRLGVTIVIVTHELAVVRALCKHVAVMEHGEVAEQFAVADPAGVPRTALGRELARQMAQADVRDELDRLEAAYA